jgi:predicted HTH transcriptional regulator
MSNELIITLFHRKPPPFATMHEPLAYKFIFNNDVISVELANPILDKTSTNEEPTQPEIILATLEDAGEPLSPTQLATITKIQDSTVRTVLLRLKNSGKVKRVNEKYTTTSGDKELL